MTGQKTKKNRYSIIFLISIESWDKDFTKK